MRLNSAEMDEKVEENHGRCNELSNIAKAEKYKVRRTFTPRPKVGDMEPLKQFIFPSTVITIY